MPTSAVLVGDGGYRDRPGAEGGMTAIAARFAGVGRDDHLS